MESAHTCDFSLYIKYFNHYSFVIRGIRIVMCSVIGIIYIIFDRVCNGEIIITILKVVEPR